MGLRFFIDHCVANSVRESLANAGHDVVRLIERLPADSIDLVVIAKAQELDAILLSLNGDFADIVNFPPSNYKGIIALQLRNHPEITEQVVARLLTYLTAHPDADHYQGKLLVIEPHRIRSRG